MLAPRAALTGTQLQSRCVAVPNHPRTRKKTKLQGVLGEYSWSGHTLPVADVVGCLPARKRNMFSRRHRLFVCHSIRQSSDSIFSLSQRWLTTFITALKLMDAKADCGHRDTILKRQSWLSSSSVSDTEISQFIEKQMWSLICRPHEIKASSSSHEEEVQ